MIRIYYSQDEYIMASMIGLEKLGQDFDSKVTDEKKEEVKGIFEKLKTNFKISDAKFNDFLTKHANSTGKIPCAKEK